MPKFRNNFKSKETLAQVPYRLFVAYSQGNIYYHHCISKYGKNTKIYNADVDKPPEKALEKLKRLFSKRQMYISAAAIFRQGIEKPYLILKGNFQTT